METVENQINDTQLLAQRNTVFVTVLSLQTIIILSASFYSLTLNIILFKVLLRNNSLRKNVQFLSMHLTIAVVVHILSVLGQCIYNMTFVIAPNVNTYWFCELFQSISGLGIDATVLFTFLFAIEQIITTVHMEKGNLKAEETVPRYIRISPFLVWLLSAIPIIPDLMNDVWKVEMVTYCHFVFKLTVNILWPLIGCLLAVESVSCVLLSLAFVKNKQQLNKFGINTVRHSLSERFHLFQTVAVNRAHLLSCLVQVVCYSITFLLRILIKTETNQEIAINILMVNLQLYSMFHVIHPLFSIRFNPTMKKHLLQNYPNLAQIFGMKQKININSVVSVVTADVVDYRQNPNATVEILENIWSKPRK